MSSATQKWTPLSGFARGVLVALVAALLLSLTLALPAILAPAVLFNAVGRAFISFAVAWLLFSAVHSAAGMTSWLCTLTSVTASFLVMLSNHFVWALYGAPFGEDGEVVRGIAFWFDPLLLGLQLLFAAVGIVLCAMICHRGVPGPDLLGHIATRPMFGQRRP